ncbi:IS110 family transposase [Mesorhizobium sp. L48C026A00]|uniref:IS110 family transposase n=1 Tax=Mesorhizobium sp. L48C026A00 TaxID=1287182 RepID=UPI0003CF9CD7|nr:IS110 family transposase [Mesorhizobium sp. L48C026A00]ESZ02770.1 hypothetical protein X737_38085 [Mesorhizobium sp. L48C026A00]
MAVKSLDSHRVRTLLSSRAQLVNMRRDLGTKIRGLLKTFGRIVGKVSRRKYEESVREFCAGVPGLEEAVSALLAVRARIEQEIRTLEEHLLGFAKHSDPCRRLMTVPGIGVLTAVSFVTAVDVQRALSVHRVWVPTSA